MGRGRLLGLAFVVLFGCGRDEDQDGVSARKDCDDTHPRVGPEATEYCDGLDNDCDGTVDNGAVDARSWYVDLDADGRGAGEATKACEAPEGSVNNDLDCDDEDPDTHAGAVERCDGVDNDCDGTIDNDAPGTVFYLDDDGDGYGDPDVTVIACEAPDDYVANGLDCNDNRPLVYPGAPESCTNADNDCNGVVDDGPDRQAYWPDADNDGYGALGTPTFHCTQPAASAPSGDDCDDQDDTQHPGAEEVCNQEDDDCDGIVDLDAPEVATYYRDEDDDGYGLVGDTVVACEQPSGFSDTPGDCDDARDSINPDQAEICDPIGRDEDCNGVADDDDPNVVSPPTWYVDADADGYGDVNDSGVVACDPGVSGLASTPGDCDDTRPDVHPNATEYVCSGVSESCTGWDADLTVTAADDLAAALTAAPADTVVCVGPGTYTAPFTLDKPGLWVVSLEGPQTTVLEGDGVGRVVLVDQAPNATLWGFTITGGLGVDNGGGVLVRGSDSAVLGNNIVTGNTTTLGIGAYDNEEGAVDGLGYGGGIAVHESMNVEVSSSVFENNVGWYGGGLAMFRNSSGAQIFDVRFEQNTAEQDGGAVGLHDAPGSTVANATFTDNTAGLFSGAMDVYLSANAEIRQVTATGNQAVNGGALTLFANPLTTLVGVELRNNTATAGGGIAILQSATVTLQSSELSENTGEFGGALYVEASDQLVVEGTAFEDNTATGSGGAGLFNTVSDARFASVQVRRNTAATLGGGFYFTGCEAISLDGTVPSDPDLRGNVFEANAATAEGGGLVAESSESFAISGTRFADNTASDGAGAYLIGLTAPSIDATDFEDNQAVNDGGGVWLGESPNAEVVDAVFARNGAGGEGGGARATADATGSSWRGVGFVENTAQTGAGLSLDTTRATLTDCDWSTNTAASFGGGLHVAESEATLFSSVVQGNTASDGGGIYGYPNAVLSLDGVDVLSNTSLDDGAGLYVWESAATVATTRFEANQSSDDGGGLYLWESTATLADTHFESNTATNDGGGLALYSNSTATLSNTQFSANTAALGGGVYRSTGAVSGTACSFDSNLPEALYDQDRTLNVVAVPSPFTCNDTWCPEEL